MNHRAQAAFADVIGDGDQTALLLDRDGVVLAGLYLNSRGLDVSAEIGVAMAGIGGEAVRAIGRLGLGEWRAVVCECGHANVALAPGADGNVMLVAAAPTVPVGFVRRLLDRALSQSMERERSAP